MSALAPGAEETIMHQNIGCAYTPWNDKGH